MTMQPVSGNADLYFWDHFPKDDLLPIITNFIFMNNGLRGLTAFALTSQDFYKICLKSCNALRNQRSFGQIPRINSEKLAKATKKESIFELNGSFVPKHLVTDDKGRHYFSFGSDALWIMHFENYEHHLLKLAEMKDNSVASQSAMAQTVVGAFPNDNGVMVVTWSGYSNWEWEENKLTFVDYFSLYDEHATHFWPIKSCSFANNALLVEVNKFTEEPSSYYIVDFSAENHNFLPIVYSEVPQNFGVQTIQMRHSFCKGLDQVRDEIFENGELILEKSSEGHWYLSILEGFPSCNMKACPIWMPYTLEHENFLLINTDQSRFVIQHLEHSYNFKSEALTSFLDQQTAHIFWAGYLEPDDCFKLFYRTECAPYSNPAIGLVSLIKQHKFTVLTIPLGIAENKQIASSPKERLPETVEEVSEMAPSPYPHGKIVIVVGALFLAFAALGTTVLIVYHPGTVIYEGSGIILTLPAVLTLSIGGSLGLATMAVGSYLWWKQQRS